MDWNAIWMQFKKDLLEFGEANLSEYLEELLEDGQEFIKSSTGKIRKWTFQLDQNQLTQEEFRSLLRGLEDSLKLEGLKQAGIAQIKLKEIRDGIIDVLLASIIKLI